MKICFDIDGVLANFVDPFLTEYVNPITGRNLRSEDMNDFKFHVAFGFTPEQEAEWFNRSREEGIFERLPIYNNGFVDFIKQDRNHDIYFNTHRSKRAIEQTYIWFMNNNIPMRNGIYFTPMFRKPTKGEMAKHLGIEVFIEDSYDNVMDIYEHVPIVCLINRPWNMKHTDLPSNVVRINDVSDLEKIIGERDGR